MVLGGLGQLCVGVVDDDESLLRAVARLLSAAGMQAITYASAEEFRADVQHPPFDCLVLDVQLPGMSGLELRDQLAAEGIATPVLFMTAHDDPRTRETAMAGRCAGFFSKTEAGSRLIDAIRLLAAPPLPG